MPTFKVVLDGLDLSDEHSQRISRAIHQSVLEELSSLDLAPQAARDDRSSIFTLLPILGGQTMGAVGTEVPIGGRLQEILGESFGG